MTPSPYVFAKMNAPVAMMFIRAAGMSTFQPVFMS
jgi:hypothetical protein